MQSKPNTPHTLITSDPTTEAVSVAMLVKWTEHTVKRAKAESVAHTLRELDSRDTARQYIEDVRANHRNLNRMLTLLGALFIGLALTFVFTHPAILASIGVQGPVVKALEPYTFVITIFMDSSLAAYSFFKRY